MENANVTAEVIEATEFPAIARKHRVMGVPKTVLSTRDTEGALDFVGAQPEPVQVDYLLKAAGLQG